MTSNSESAAVAIVGMAGRFPGAANVAAFWRMLCDGREGIQFFREEELTNSRTPLEVLRRPNYVPAKGMLERAEEFDAELFGLHPRDALVIDPQQRLLLETCWEALEDAACDPRRFDGLIGVFAGVSMNSWIYELLSNEELRRTVSAYQLMISNDKDYAATRVSYELDLKGPSIGIQTACSTSLVAVERACQSLVAQECDLALAAAASLAYPRKCGYLHEEGMILSPDGHCRTFDALARGTVPGEGVAAVVLKRLDDALSDRNAIYAVIRGWATNNDGANKIGYTAPSISGQASVIALAQAFAGVSPDSIEYIEAHGTATPLGDPIELAALAEVFRARTSRRHYCRIGSVKSNIGHLDTVAGLAGLIKTALALKHGQIPPSLHFERPNPEIDFEQSPFQVATSLVAWPRRDTPRFAGVSSFGIGGTNCHLVLEEPPADAASATMGLVQPRQERPQLLLVSGATSRAADEAAERLAQHIQREAGHSLCDIAFTLQVGRPTLAHRRVLVATDRDHVLAVLASRDPSRWTGAVSDGSRWPLTLLFPGQGVQQVGMAREFYDRYSEYRRTMDECLRILHSVTGHDWRDLLLGGASGENRGNLTDTAFAQPAIFATSFALAQMLLGWGLKPDSLLGHSVGELVAACVAGVMTLPDALQIVIKRGELMQSVEPGAMLAVALDDVEVESLLTGHIVLAAQNAPRLSVLAGPTAEIDGLERRLAANNQAAWRLHTSHAFHSPQMEPIQEPFRRVVAQFSLRPPRIPFVSNVTGTWITDQQATSPEYWSEHLRRTVRFRDGVLLSGGELPRAFLEVGPGQTLRTHVRETLGSDSAAVVVSTMKSPQQRRHDEEVLLEALGRLWLVGIPCDWEAVSRDDRPRRLHLPTYPFQRQQFSVPRQQVPPQVTIASEISKRPLSQWYYAPSWTRAERTAPLGPTRPPQCWLVFLDTLGVGEEIARQIRRRGERVISIRPGTQYERHSPEEFSIPPGRFGGYSRIFKEAFTPEAPIDRIVHLWSLTGESEVFDGKRSAEAEKAMFDESQQIGFYSLLFLTQTLGRQQAIGAVQIDVVTDGVQDVSGEEPLDPAKATIRAPILVAPQEYPHLRCRHIDMIWDRNAPDRRGHLEQLLAELDAPLSDPEIAFRGRRRWVRTYQALSLPDTPPVRLPEPRIASVGSGDPVASSGAWLILGGLGQIGLVAAGWLAMTRRSPLVLVGRSAFPTRDAWDDWLVENDADDPTSRRIAGLKRFIELGCDVQVFSADISSTEQLRQVARQAVQRFGRIEGVIHSAGVVESQIIHYTSPTDCVRQFQAKVAGVQSLAAIVDEFAIPICIVNSSLSSVLGGLGFCAYAASNLFLDVFLQRQQRAGKSRWIGINWDGWLFPDVAEWMGNDPALRLTLAPQDGIECLERIVRWQEACQVIVSTGDLEERRRLWVRREEFDTSQQPQTSKETLRHPRPASMATPYVAPRGDVERTISDVWEELLGIDGIGVHDDYLALGGHSLLAGQIIGRLRDRLKVPLSIRSLFEYSTIHKLANHVAAVRLTLGFDAAKEGPEAVEVEL